MYHDVTLTYKASGNKTPSDVERFVSFGVLTNPPSKEDPLSSKDSPQGTLICGELSTIVYTKVKLCN